MIELRIVIISKDRYKMLADGVNSVLLALNTSPNVHWREAKIYVGFNGDLNSANLFKKEFGHHENIEFFSYEKHLYPGAARNRLLNEVPPGWTLFLDDDVEIPIDYFVHFNNIISQDPYERFIGGPNINFKNADPIEVAQGMALGSMYIAGPFAQRYSFRKTHVNRFSTALILCNLWVNRSGPEPSVFFDENLSCAEENELFLRFKQSAGDVFRYEPKLYIYHHRRKTFQEFYRQSIKFGLGRAQLMKKQCSLYGLLYPLLVIFYPVFAVLSLVSNLILSPFVGGIRRGLKFNLFVLLSGFFLQIGYFTGIIQGLYRGYNPAPITDISIATSSLNRP